MLEKKQCVKRQGIHSTVGEKKETRDAFRLFQTKDKITKLPYSLRIDPQRLHTHSASITKRMLPMIVFFCKKLFYATKTNGWTFGDERSMDPIEKKD